MKLIFTIVAALCSVVLLNLAIAAPIAPLASTQTVHFLDWGDDLPMYDGDLDEIHLEVVAGSYYEHQQQRNAGPCPYSITFYWALQAGIEAFGGELYLLEAWNDSVILTGTGPTTVDTGLMTEDVDDSAPRMITSDTRCDLFEGTGTVDLDWVGKSSIGATTNYGCNTASGWGSWDLTNIQIKVTYVPK